MDPIRKHTCLAAAALLGGALLVPRAVPAAEAQKGRDFGRELYLQYCSACHGPEGRGDGVAAEAMNPKPANLRMINARNEGKFPFQATMHQLDGSTPIRAHGDPDLPVWGESWHPESATSVDQRAEAQGKVVLLTYYLLSIQINVP